ncbi:hypothetical protein LJR219_002709 [Phenylobacterium sp. LjRoot219]|uniref:hypothetical protein n=1 Tax=Phenylobacterium sp. LjRoot219 TaxID=3342283 RepID=UPI003ECF14E8
MSYHSLRIEAFATSTTVEELEAPWVRPQTVSNLAEYAFSYGPFQLATWAKSRLLPVHYVDNSWIRVPVDQHELARFLSEELHVPTFLAIRVRESAPLGRLIVIEAEEY